MGAVVEHPCIKSHILKSGFHFFGFIDGVADDGMTDGGEVDADLVSAASKGLDFEEGFIFVAFYNFELCDCWFWTFCPPTLSLMLELRGIC